MVYFGHRYYHPGMGRFLNKDPIGKAGGLNRYAYALNDPINRTDYRGLCYTGPADSLGYRYFQSMSDPIYGSEPIDNRFLGSSSGRQQSSTTAGAAVSTDGAAADSAESGTSRPYRLIKTDANGNGLVEVTDREAFDAMVRDWENATGQQGLIPRDRWDATGEFDIGGNFHIIGFRIKAPWEGGTSWLNQSEPAGGQASSQGGSGSISPVARGDARIDQSSQHYESRFYDVPGSGTSGSGGIVPDWYNDPNVTKELDQAWAASNPNAPDVMRGQPGSIKLEHGGWIRERPWWAFWRDDRYSVEYWPSSGATGDSMQPTRRPSGTVGVFHTHPNTEAEGYSPQPGQSDINFTRNHAKVPHVVLTHNGAEWIYP